MNPLSGNLIRLLADAEEVAGIIAANITAQAEIEKREVRPDDAIQGIAPLLAAAWHLAQLASSDRKIAADHFTGFLIRFAAGIREQEGL